MLLTDWNFWQQGISGYTTPITGPLGNSGYDSPVTLNYLDNSSNPPNLKYATVYPLNFYAAPPNVPKFTFYVDKVLIPFSYDFPNYLFYVTQKSGRFDVYNQFYNLGSDFFYLSPLS